MARAINTQTLSEKLPTTVILTHEGTGGQTKKYVFNDKSIRYFDKLLANSFDYVLFDNVGTGDIRISYNFPTLDITGYANGSKTLKAKDSFYIEDDIWCVNIYYIGDSATEIVLKTDKDF